MKDDLCALGVHFLLREIKEVIKALHFSRRSSILDMFRAL